MALDLDRLQRLLGGSDLAGLRARLRARFETGRSGDEFTLTGLAAAERRALAGLLGRPAGGNGVSMRVRGSDLDAALRHAGVADTLREALEAIEGPIHDLRAARTARDAAWRAWLNGVVDPRLRTLVDDATGAALLKRFASHDPQRAAQLLDDVGRVLNRLPERGRPLAQLAASALGDAHALDAGQPIATLVLRAFGLEQSIVDGERTRAQWARLGITVNELAAPVLGLNLPATGNSVAATVARAAAGDPVHLSLRMLLRDPPAWDVAGRRVFVCENPSILSLAADHLGAASAPLICTSGMPAAAQQTLLRQLVERGAKLAYHGDFDWPGIRIGNFVMRELQASAWRFSTGDYAVACDGVTGTLPEDERVEALWDAQLSTAMCAQRRSVHEEAVWQVLMDDLTPS